MPDVSVELPYAEQHLFQLPRSRWLSKGLVYSFLELWDFVSRSQKCSSWSLALEDNPNTSPNLLYDRYKHSVIFEGVHPVSHESLRISVAVLGR